MTSMLTSHELIFRFMGWKGIKVWLHFVNQILMPYQLNSWCVKNIQKFIDYSGNCLFTVCLLFVYCLFIVCLLFVYCLFIFCLLFAYCLFIVCLLFVYCLCIVVYCLFIFCLLFAYCLFIACLLFVYCCLLFVYCLFIPEHKSYSASLFLLNTLHVDTRSYNSVLSHAMLMS
jgi:hypothetical protein